jgi:Ca2+-binding RTX toxin-like protein
MDQQIGSVRPDARKASSVMEPAVAVAFTFAAVDASEAATVSVDNGVLLYAEEPGEPETNAVLIQSGTFQGGPGYTILEVTGTEITPGPGCEQNINGPAIADCTASVSLFSIDLGARDDSVDLPTDSPRPSVVSGGEGSDTVVGGNSTDTVDGGSGDDRFLGELFDRPSVVGDFGDDTFAGGSGNDTFFAKSAFDCGESCPLANGGDDFIGGEGEDTADYHRGLAPVNVSLDGVANDGEGGEGDNIFPDVETVVGSPAADTISGNEAGNVLKGFGGDDTLLALGGNDTLEGAGNAGNEDFWSSFSDGVVAAPPPDAGSDRLDGGNGDDSLDGGHGGDSLDGGAGSDSLEGGGGVDSLAGGDGNDGLSGGSAGDTISGGAGDDALRGGASGLIGADGDDTLRGDGGNDSLGGDEGDDLLDGGPGADSMSGGDGRDAATYEGRRAAIFVTLDDLANDGEAQEGDNVRRDVEEVFGGGNQDDLLGDVTANALDGREGEDYVDGRVGSDALRGGSEKDTIRSRDGSRDVVTCGGDVDFAIADTSDTVIGCERVDRGVNNVPVAGDSLVARPTRGPISLRLPDTRRFVPLQDRVNVPVRSALDTSRVPVELTAAGSVRRRGRSRARQRATFEGGAFRIAQRRSRRPLTEIRLEGGDFTQCPTTGRARRSVTTSQTRRRVRRLFGRGRGRFRTRGRYSSVTIRGTTWSVEDRCDGTLTRITSGRAVVFDFARKRRVALRRGQSYLARPRR